MKAICSRYDKADPQTVEMVDSGYGHGYCPRCMVERIALAELADGIVPDHEPIGPRFVAEDALATTVAVSKAFADAKYLYAKYVGQWRPASANTVDWHRDHGFARAEFVGIDEDGDGRFEQVENDGSRYSYTLPHQFLTLTEDAFADWMEERMDVERRRVLAEMERTRGKDRAAKEAQYARLGRELGKST